MSEIKATNRLLKILNQIPGCYAKKRHGGAFQSGEPDIMGCLNGKSFFIEMKDENGKLTELQSNSLQRWREAGAITYLGVYYSRDNVVRMIYTSDRESWNDKLFWSVSAKRVEGGHRLALNVHAGWENLLT